MDHANLFSRVPLSLALKTAEQRPMFQLEYVG